jgi:hypothetical protein
VVVRDEVRLGLNLTTAAVESPRREQTPSNEQPHRNDSQDGRIIRLHHGMGSSPRLIRCGYAPCHHILPEHMDFHGSLYDAESRDGHFGTI